MLLVVITLIVDQLTKIWAYNNKVNMNVINRFLNFTYVENRGAIFGIMQGSNIVMAILSCIICILLGAYILNLRKSDSKVFWGYYLILSGGIGNIIDRLVRGFVVDFIDTPFIATFNFADTCVVLGVIFVLVNELLQYAKKEKSDGK